MNGIEDHGGYRVHIERQYRIYGGVGIWLVRRRVIDGAPQTAVARSPEPAFTWADQDEAVMLPDRPSLVLDDSLGRVLLDELAGYYGGTGEARTLRRDYDAERARVDKLIGHLIGGPR